VQNVCRKAQNATNQCSRNVNVKKNLVSISLAFWACCAFVGRFKKLALGYTICHSAFDCLNIPTSIIMKMSLFFI
jgi:hypothetical protein